MLEEGLKRPQEYIKKFDKYQSLITREVHTSIRTCTYMHTYIQLWLFMFCVLLQAEQEVEQFLREEHTFLEYEKLVYRYQEVVSELQYSVEKVHIHVYTCMYHLVSWN